jgi:Domain of unknown function (DUF397)
LRIRNSSSHPGAVETATGRWIPIQELRSKIHQTVTSINTGCCTPRTRDVNQLTVIAPNAHLSWRKASSSTADGECVEVARAQDVIAIRDSKNPDGPMLCFAMDQWKKFLAVAKDGRMRFAGISVEFGGAEAVENQTLYILTA